MNVFKELVLSVYDFKSYKEFLKNKGSKVFLAALILMLIYFTATILIPLAQFQIQTGGIARGLRENVPEFQLQDGTLWVDEIVEYEDGGTYVLIDTDPDSVFYDAGEIDASLTDYTQVILMDSEKMIVKDNGQVNGMYFSDMDLELSKDDLKAIVPFIYVFGILILVLAFWLMTGLFFFGVLFVALVGMIAASCLKCNLTFGQIYLLGIYARTLPILIKAVVSFLPFGIPMFWVLNFGLSILYLILAMQKMKETALDKPLEFNSDETSNT